MNLMHQLGTGIVAGVIALSVYGANPETANDGYLKGIAREI